MSSWFSRSVTNRHLVTLPAHLPRELVFETIKNRDLLLALFWTLSRGERPISPSTEDSTTVSQPFKLRSKEGGFTASISDIPSGVFWSEKMAMFEISARWTVQEGPESSNEHAAEGSVEGAKLLEEKSVRCPRIVAGFVKFDEGKDLKMQRLTQAMCLLYDGSVTVEELIDDPTILPKFDMVDEDTEALIKIKQL